MPYQARLTLKELRDFRTLFKSLSPSDTTEVAMTPNDGQGDGKILVTLDTIDPKSLEDSFNEGLLNAYGWKEIFKKI